MGNKNFMVLDTKKYDEDNTLYYYLYNPEKVLIYSEKALKAEMTKNNLSVLNISKHLEKKMILTVTDYRLPLTVPQNEKESFYFDLLDDLICGPFNANIPFKVLYKIQDVLKRIENNKIVFKRDLNFIDELLTIMYSYFNYLDLEGMKYKYHKKSFEYSIYFRNNDRSRGIDLNVPTTGFSVYNSSCSTIEQIYPDYMENSYFKKWYKNNEEVCPHIFEYTCFLDYIKNMLRNENIKDNVLKMSACVEILIDLLRNINYSYVGELLFCGFSLNLSSVLSTYINKVMVIPDIKQREEFHIVIEKKNKETRKKMFDDLADKRKKDIKERVKRIKENSEALNKLISKYNKETQSIINVFFNDVDKEKDISPNLKLVYSNVLNKYKEIDKAIQALPPKEIMSVFKALSHAYSLCKDLFTENLEGAKNKVESIIESESELTGLKNLAQEQVDRFTHNSLSQESKEIVNKFKDIKPGYMGALFYCLDRYRHIKGRLEYYKVIPYSPIEVQPLLFYITDGGMKSLEKLEVSWLSAYYWYYEKLEYNYYTKMYCSDFYVYFFKKTLATQVDMKNKDVIYHLKEFEKHLYGSKEFGWRVDPNFDKKVNISNYIIKERKSSF